MIGIQSHLLGKSDVLTDYCSEMLCNIWDKSELSIEQPEKDYACLTYIASQIIGRVGRRGMAVAPQPPCFLRLCIILCCMLSS